MITKVRHFGELTYIFFIYVAKTNIVPKIINLSFFTEGDFCPTFAV